MLKLTIIQLINCNFFFGTTISKWNSSVLRFLLGFRNNFCVFDPSFFLLILRKSFFLLFDILLVKGEVFFLGMSDIMNSFMRVILFKIFKYPYDFFFKGGCISNFKEVKKKLYAYRYLWKTPSIFFFFDNMNSSTIIFESLYSKTPLVSLVDSNINNYKGNYSLLGNTSSFLTIYYYIQLVLSLVFTINKRLTLSFISKFFKKFVFFNKDKNKSKNSVKGNKINFFFSSYKILQQFNFKAIKIKNKSFIFNFYNFKKYFGLSYFLNFYRILKKNFNLILQNVKLFFNKKKKKKIVLKKTKIFIYFFFFKFIFCKIFKDLISLKKKKLIKKFLFFLKKKKKKLVKKGKLKSVVAHITKDKYRKIKNYINNLYKKSINKINKYINENLQRNNLNVKKNNLNFFVKKVLSLTSLRGRFVIFYKNNKLVNNSSESCFFFKNKILSLVKNKMLKKESYDLFFKMFKFEENLKKKIKNGLVLKNNKGFKRKNKNNKNFFLKKKNIRLEKNKNSFVLKKKESIDNKNFFNNFKRNNNNFIKNSKNNILVGNNYKKDNFKTKLLLNKKKKKENLEYFFFNNFFFDINLNKKYKKTINLLKENGFKQNIIIFFRFEEFNFLKKDIFKSQSFGKNRFIEEGSIFFFKFGIKNLLYFFTFMKNNILNYFKVLTGISKELTKKKKIKLIFFRLLKNKILLFLFKYKIKIKKTIDVIEKIYFFQFFFFFFFFFIDKFRYKLGFYRIKKILNIKKIFNFIFKIKLFYNFFTLKKNIIQKGFFLREKIKELKNRERNNIKKRVLKKNLSFSFFDFWFFRYFFLFFEKKNRVSSFYRFLFLKKNKYLFFFFLNKKKKTVILKRLRGKRRRRALFFLEFRKQKKIQFKKFLKMMSNLSKLEKKKRDQNKEYLKIFHTIMDNIRAKRKGLWTIKKREKSYLYKNFKILNKKLIKNIQEVILKLKFIKSLMKKRKNRNKVVVKKKNLFSFLIRRKKKRIEIIKFKLRSLMLHKFKLNFFFNLNILWKKKVNV